MAFTEKELKQREPKILSFIETIRPPEEVRSQVGIGYTIADQSFIIYTSQMGPAEKKLKFPLAKVTWVRTKQIWKIYWKRADMNWHKYDPLSQTHTLQELSRS